MHSRKTLSLALLAATTLVVAACGGANRMSSPPPAQNAAPVISAIGDRSVMQDTPATIAFEVTDRESDAATLELTAAADGASVFPADGVVTGGTGVARTLTLTPLEAATGTATITLTLTDPQGAQAMRSFVVTVAARNASMRSTALTTFAKAESDDVTTVNGLTFEQDADDPALFEPLLGAE